MSNNDVESLLIDDFGDDVAAGAVIGTSTRSDDRRWGRDVEKVISIDHGALRVAPPVRPGWGRATIGYGPVALTDGLVASVTLLNGRNGSENVDPWPSPGAWFRQWMRGTQSDSPLGRLPRVLRFPARDRLRRRLATARHDASLEPGDRGDLNLALSWSPTPDSANPVAVPSFLVRSTGPDNADLCVTRDACVEPAIDLGEVPMRLAMLCTDGAIAFLVSIDGEPERWPDLRFVGATGGSPSGDQWLILQQRILGQVGWGMDTRVWEVRIDRLDDPPTLDALRSGSTLELPSGVMSRLQPIDHPQRFVDRFRSGSGDLDGRAVAGRTWRRVIGERRLEVAPDGLRVGDPRPVPSGRLARLVRPSGQRTACVVDWAGPVGSIEAEITPPGSARGEGQAGRAGLILYEDGDNHLIVNDWLDDEYPGASVSVFRRIRGFEEVYDAVWVNVGARITWGRPHRLALGFDEVGFTAYLDGAAVLARAYSDVYPDAPPLRVRAVGVCANWEFGDDTGSRFTWFRAGGPP